MKKLMVAVMILMMNVVQCLAEDVKVRKPSPDYIKVKSSRDIKATVGASVLWESPMGCLCHPFAPITSYYPNAYICIGRDNTQTVVHHKIDCEFPHFSKKVVNAVLIESPKDERQAIRMYALHWSPRVYICIGRDDRRTIVPHRLDCEFPHFSKKVIAVLGIDPPGHWKQALRFSSGKNF